jgi:dipeptidyl aminopeptidase/acylaminoacyl peptidase
MLDNSVSNVRRRLAVASLLLFGVLAVTGVAVAQEPFTLDDAARLRTVTQAVVSPDGEMIAYVLSVPRSPGVDEDGGAWAELHVIGPEERDRPFLSGEVNVGAVAWTPDGGGISFLAQREGDEKRSLYVIRADGGEARKVLEHDENITSYSWSADGSQVAFLAKAEADPKIKKLADKGFKAEVYEEDLTDVEVWIVTIEAGKASGEPRMLELDGSASELHWAPEGNRIAVALAPTSHIDDHYMKRNVYVIDTESGATLATIANPGKLGEVAWSPDGSTIAMIAAQDPNDPAAGRLLVAPATGGTPAELLAPDYEGDVVAFAFMNAETIVYVAHEGVQALVASVGVDGSGAREFVAAGGPIYGSLSLSADGSVGATVADSPTHPGEVFNLWRAESNRLTDSNPWLAERRLATQEPVTYSARDGLEVEGLLIRPLDESGGHPLIVVVHGGPEAHYSNGWLTRYSTPGQFAAAEGYAVFYPNYRGSTGRGVAYSKLDQADYAGGEFNDLVDGVKHLVATGLVDESKVGVTGGSYGGFASAWCATALTEHFAASVMFVGISDQISKFGTTDIPNEMFMVHARRYPWDYWDWFRERSPVYHTPKARTPILILHGEEDTRVHPSQSMELYRYLKTLGKVPVRLVLYPGEGHGNRNAGARYDYSMRLMRWMNHYLKGPGGDPPPPELEYPMLAEEEEEGS